jgi:hypothetical protein
MHAIHVTRETSLWHTARNIDVRWLMESLAARADAAIAAVHFGAAYALPVRYQEQLDAAWP